MRLVAALIVAAGLIAVVAVAVLDSASPASNEVPVSELEDSRYGVVYLEEHNIFVVDTDDGPIALVGDAQHVPDDPVWYCPSSDWFEGPYHGARFDRLGRYAAGPADSDMDRVASRITDRVIVVELDGVIESAGRSRVADPSKGPSCDGAPEQPGFFPPTPID